VIVQDDEDGMSWISAYIPTIEALAAKRRLTATAKHLQKDPREMRTRDQIRADLLSEWLRGIGTDRAVQTKVFVTVPVQLLSAGQSHAEPGAQPHSAEATDVVGGLDPATAPDSATTSESVSLPAPVAEIIGHGPIPPLAAKQLFLDAKAFRRVIVDPIRSVVIDMDRRSRRATQAQRDWLMLQHGTCARDGCNRLAQDAEIDHKTPWAQGGNTDLDELRPLCPRDHVVRHRTRLIYRSRPDESVEVVTPTGFRSTAPPRVVPTVPPF
jgi:hypothetical protein